MNIKCAFVTALKAGKTIKQRGQKLLNKKKRKNINSFFHSLTPTKMDQARDRVLF